MSVVSIKDGIVVQVWRDVTDIAAAVAKYDLDPANLVKGDHPPGTLWDGATFSPPPPPPPPDWATIDRATVDALLLESGVMRAVALMMFEMGKAGKTGNWAFFDGVIDKPTFKTLFMSMIR